MTIHNRFKTQGIHNRYQMVVEVISALLLLLFLYTALSKIMTYNAFVAALKDIPLIGIHASIIAWLIPAAELIIALLLFLPAARLSGLFVSLFSLLLFTGYLLYMIVYAPTLPCNCGGVINSFTWKQHILFNLIFIAINIVALLSHTKIRSAKKRTPP